MCLRKQTTRTNMCCCDVWSSWLNPVLHVNRRASAAGRELPSMSAMPLVSISSLRSSLTAQSEILSLGVYTSFFHCWDNEKKENWERELVKDLLNPVLQFIFWFVLLLSTSLSFSPNAFSCRRRVVKRLKRLRESFLICRPIYFTRERRQETE